LVGGVRNLCDGGVEVIVEGKRALLEQLLAMLRKGPPLASVDHVQVEWDAATGESRTFEVWRDR
jgi:acylphosphatase